MIFFFNFTVDIIFEDSLSYLKIAYVIIYYVMIANETEVIC